MDTQLAIQLLRNIEDKGIFVPSNVKFGYFSQFAMDNLDFHEHTKDGKTLHATSHNIYQYITNHGIENKQFTVPNQIGISQRNAISSS